MKAKLIKYADRIAAKLTDMKLHAYGSQSYL